MDARSLRQISERSAEQRLRQRKEGAQLRLARLRRRKGKKLREMRTGVKLELKRLEEGLLNAANKGKTAYDEKIGIEDHTPWKSEQNDRMIMLRNACKRWLKTHGFKGDAWITEYEVAGYPFDEATAGAVYQRIAVRVQAAW